MAIEWQTRQLCRNAKSLPQDTTQDGADCSESVHWSTGGRACGDTTPEKAEIPEMPFYHGRLPVVRA